MNPTLTFIGKDSGFGKNNTSAYLEIENNLYIIDCGCTVFNKLKEKFNFNRYNSINIIITHLHNDHAGSLSQLLLYLWFVYNKKAIVISKCKHISEYLRITGVPDNSYELKINMNNLEFIETTHTEYLDSYGFKANFNDKTILYTGDTNTIEPFLPYISITDELYIDVSKNGGAHLKIDDILEILIKIKNTGTNIFLMHMDDEQYIKNKFPDLYI